jgi:hypothetical protein
MGTGLRRTTAVLICALLAWMLCATPSHAQERPLADETLSALNLNLQGRNSVYGPWRERYGSISRWMQAEGTVPDLLVLQETPARKCWFLGGCDPLDYEAVFEILGTVETATGVAYRVAFLSTGPPYDHLDPLYQGRAVLYNPARLTNVTPNPGGTQSSATLTRTLEPHASHPCRNPARFQVALCARIDTDGTNPGPHWAAEGVAFARFAFAEHASPVVVDIYDEHAPILKELGGVPDHELVANAVQRMEALHPPAPGTRLIPPVLIGDFNATRSDMENEVVGSNTLWRFELTAFPPPATEVIGTLVGNPQWFPARFAATAVTNRFLPEDGLPLCGPPRVRWSDHCAQFVEFAMTPPQQQSSWVFVPNVVKLPVADAKSAVLGAGLTVSISEKADPTCERVGQVLQQSPAGGTQVVSGATVSITVWRLPSTACP